MEASFDMSPQEIFDDLRRGSIEMAKEDAKVDLPEGWLMMDMADGTGRVRYLDVRNRIGTWFHPIAPRHKLPESWKKLIWTMYHNEQEAYRTIHNHMYYSNWSTDARDKAFETTSALEQCLYDTCPDGRDWKKLARVYEIWAPYTDLSGRKQPSCIS